MGAVNGAISLFTGPRGRDRIKTSQFLRDPTSTATSQTSKAVPMGVLSMALQHVQSAIGLSAPSLDKKIFDEEAENWLSEKSPLKFTYKIVLPGLPRGYEEVHLSAVNAVCLLVVGTALVNAALSVATLTSSTNFNLTKTYFLLTGIAGVNPRHATIGAVAFAKFTCQVDTQLEVDAREIPPSWDTGYTPMGAETPDAFPKLLHGSEVYELNDDLRQAVLSFARTASLEDTIEAANYRKLYSGSPGDIFHAATLKPSIVEGDVASSNVFWHGNLLCEGMAKVMKIYTSGKAEYVMTALLRAALQKQVDFSRIILTRSGSNFDRGYNDEPITLPFVMDLGGLGPAKRNLYLSGLKVVMGILNEWHTFFEDGIVAKTYIGDIFGSLGGDPDFGPKREDIKIRN